MILKKFTLIGLLCFLAVLSASAQESADDRTPGLSDIRALVDAGKPDQARRLLLSMSRNLLDIVLLEVEIAISEGRVEDGIDLLRKLSAQAPQLTPVRMRLVQLLVMDKQYDNARYQLDLLRSQASNDDERAFFAAQIQDIEDRQPYGFQGTFTLVPSDNINNASPADYEEFAGLQIPIPEELKPQFGWRMAIGGNAYYRTKIKDNHEIMTSLFAETGRYTVDTLDYSLASLSVNYRFQNAKSDISIGPYVTRYFGDGKVYKTVTGFGSDTSEAEIISRDEDYTTIGARFGFSQIINAKNSFGVSLRYSDTQYDDYEQYFARHSFEREIGVNYRRVIHPRHAIRFDLGIKAHVEAGPNEDWNSSSSYDEQSLGISLQSKFSNQWQGKFGFDYRKRGYDDRKYPGLDQYRHDDYYEISIGLLNSKWQIWNFVPRLDCAYQFNKSNIESREYHGTQCGIVMTTDF